MLFGQSESSLLRRISVTSAAICATLTSWSVDHREQQKSTHTRQHSVFQVGPQHTCFLPRSQEALMGKQTSSFFFHYLFFPYTPLRKIISHSQQHKRSLSGPAGNAHTEKRLCKPLYATCLNKQEDTTGPFPGQGLSLKQNAWENYFLTP